MSVPTAGVGNYEWWKYVIMPFMAGLVGWLTNVLALKMTFYPIEYVGFNLFRIQGQPWGILGWQGIIPTRAEKMATICVTLMTEQLFDTQEIFNRLDPQRFYEVMEDGLLIMIDEIVNDITNIHMAKAWHDLPENAKDEVILYVNEACPDFMNGFLHDVQKNIYDVLDIKQMAVNACIANRELVNKIFLECAVQELAFIRRSGLYFGFLFGCLQMGLLFVYNGKWLLPVCGFLVGWFTNFLAFKIIFRPLQPKKVGNCFTIPQGLFLKRQKEVSETFASVICKELLTTETMWDEIMKGPKHRNFQLLLRTHSIALTEKLIGRLRPIAVTALGPKQFGTMEQDVANKVIDMLPRIINLSYEYTTEALDLENTISERMEGLTPREFEGVLHPAFEEDEMTLIMIGGVLGALVGVIQMQIF